MGVLAQIDWRDGWPSAQATTPPPEPELRVRLTDRLHRRERRIFYLLVGVWIVNMFDLGFSLLAQQQRVLFELNPVAAYLFNHGPAAVAAYKLTLLIFGTAILWRYRQHRASETAAWVCAICCVALSLWWHELYLEVAPLYVQLNMVNDILPNRLALISQLGSAPP